MPSGLELVCVFQKKGRMVERPRWTLRTPNKMNGSHTANIQTKFLLSKKRCSFFLSFRLFVFEKNALFFLFQEVSADRRCLFFWQYVAFFLRFAVFAGKSREKKAKSSGVWRKSRELFIESWEGVAEEGAAVDKKRVAMCAPWGVGSRTKAPSDESRWIRRTAFYR